MTGTMTAARRPVRLAADRYEWVLALGAILPIAGFFTLPLGRLLGNGLFG